MFQCFLVDVRFVFYSFGIAAVFGNHALAERVCWSSDGATSHWDVGCFLDRKWDATGSLVRPRAIGGY